jgi:hypothetical protein
MAIVYRHINKENGEVFYVGIGKSEKRAYTIKKRSVFWNNYVSKHQFYIEITHSDICWEEACSIEKYLISFYGRRDLCLGNLVNMTDGGDGLANPSKQTRELISFAAKNISDSTRQKMSDSQRKSIRPKCSEETKQKISNAQKGREIPIESKIKMSESHKGKKLSEKHKQKLREVCKPNTGSFKKGHSMSIATKDKLRATSWSVPNKGRFEKGVKMPEHIKLKMLETRKKNKELKNVSVLNTYTLTAPATLALNGFTLTNP